MRTTYSAIFFLFIYERWRSTIVVHFITIYTYDANCVKEIPLYKYIRVYNIKSDHISIRNKYFYYNVSKNERKYFDKSIILTSLKSLLGSGIIGNSFE